MVWHIKMLIRPNDYWIGEPGVVIPLIFNCWISAGTGTRCHICRSRASHMCSRMDRDGFSFQKLRTDSWNMGSCIVMLQHEVLVMNEWHNKQDLVTVSLRIQDAIQKRQLCLLSIKYAYPKPHWHHGPVKSHHWHQQTHMRSYTICPVQWKPGFICK